MPCKIKIEIDLKKETKIKVSFLLTQFGFSRKKHCLKAKFCLTYKGFCDILFEYPHV